MSSAAAPRSFSAGLARVAGPERSLHLPGRDGYRADIEGLRGMAVLLVVLFHTGVPGMGGGFIGVDVFFVLSGYLITDLLAKEAARNGKIDFVQFYARRTRRLLPASVLVLGVTLLLGTMVFSPLEQVRYIRSALAASVYMSNLQFLRQASHYFAANLSGDPFLHTWSLAVEEQFYLAWPLLVVLGFGGVRSRSRLLRVIGAVSLAAFVGCLWLTWVRKPWAFFASPARAWEFGLGGLACMLPPAALQARAGVCRWLGWTGIALIVLSGVLVSGNWLFPGVWAIPPVIGTIAALVAGVGAPREGIGPFLGSRPLQWLGRLSYSWYLWHWPVLVGARAMWPDISLQGRVMASLASLGAAALSFYAVENRIRFHPGLVKRPRLSLALAGTLSVAGLSFALGASRYATYASTVPAQRPYAKAERDLSDLYRTKCLLMHFADDTPKECVFGDSSSPVTVVLMGDSHAAHWFAALQRVAEERRWRLVSLVKTGCPTARVPVFDPRVGHEADVCDTWRQRALRRILALRPTAVVLANSLAYVRRPGREARYSHLSFGQWEKGNRETFRTLDSAGVRTILFRDSPRPGFDVPVCLSRATYRGEPVGQCGQDRHVAVDGTVFAAEQRAASGLTHVSLVDFTDLICEPERCEAIRDSMVVYSDDNHLTAAYARSLGPEMSGQLASLMGLQRAVHRTE